MTDIELQKWITDHRIAPEVQLIIRRVRQSDPSRIVQGGRCNVIGRYPSRKMRCTIQFESHKVEFPFALMYENDDGVLEYYDQPPPIKISYINNNDRKVTIVITPDFFTICSDGTVGYEECKEEAELVRLSEKSKDRYVKDENGDWCSPAGEEAAAKEGLYFKIRSSSAINWTLYRNQILLEDYRREDTITVCPDAQALITTIIESNEGMALSELLDDQNGFTANDVFRLILNGTIYVDIYRYVLATPTRVPVFSSSHYSLNVDEPTTSQPQNTLTSILINEPGTKIKWGTKEFTIGSHGDGAVWLLNKEGKMIQVTMNDFEQLVHKGNITSSAPVGGIENSGQKRLMKMGTKDHRRALQRREVIAPYLHSTTPLKTTRSIRRWVAKYLKAEVNLNSGLLGLYDDNKDKGNKSIRLMKESYSIMDTFIENEYLTATKPNVKSIHGQYMLECTAQGVMAASYVTFCKRVESLPKVLKAERREGKRAAYQLSEFYLELSMTTPKHGDRPFEIAHIDHTQLDIELICPITHENLGRPWLTIMIDANSRRILAYYLSFDPPSYRSCMCVIRECGIRYMQLPQIIIVDNGKEFKSEYFEQFLAMYEITKKDRPPAQARFGSVVERIFGTVHTQFIYNLLGNTQATKKVRQMTKSFNPKLHAVWTIELFAERLEKYLFDVYDTKHHSGIMTSPREAFEYGMFQFGKRRIIQPECLQDFIFSALPATKTGYAKVLQSKGVKINNIYYHHPSLMSATVIGTKVQVKYDPFNFGLAFAYVKKQWVECKSDYYAIFNGLTEKEVKAISMQLKLKLKKNNQSATVSGQQLAEFIVTTKGTEKVLLEQKHAQQQRDKLSTQTQGFFPEPPTLPETTVDPVVDDITESDADYGVMDYNNK